jgi:hypothetical protein
MSTDNNHETNQNTDKELAVAVILSKYVDKYGANILNAGLDGLPEEVQGWIYQAIKQQPPDASLADLIEPTDADHGKKTTWSVPELLDADFPEPVWTVPDMIPIGLVSLAGRPKVGKSWMALQLAIAVASGGYFLGQKVNKAEVLYLALEDHSRRLKARIKQIGVNREAPITFKTEYKPLDGEGLMDLQYEIASGRYKLIIVDTFGRSLTAGKLEIKDYSDNVMVLAPLQKMAQDLAVTILLVDHHAKINGENPITDLIGSIGKSATFDCVMGLYKEQGRQGAKLMIVGRDLDDIELSLEFDSTTGSWQCLGDTKSVIKQNVYDAIHTLVSNGELATTKNITAYIGGTYESHVSRAIADLLSERKIKKLPKIGVQQPYDTL